MKKKEQKRDLLHDEDLAANISQFSCGAQEKAFIESITYQQPEKDPCIRVAERLRKAREDQGLTLQDISQRTDIPIAELAKIEDGVFLPPLGTIIRLAKAINMKMGYFISGDEECAYTIVRHHDRKTVSRFGSEKGKQYGYEYESLAPYKKDRHMEPFLVTLEPADTAEERSTHDGQEFIFVLQGQMEVRLEDQIHVLGPGDAIYYDSTVPHLVKCHGREETKILAVLYTEK